MDTAWKVREELVARAGAARAGEANTTIRSGKIVSFDSGVHLSQGQKSSVMSGETASTPGVMSSETGDGSRSQSQGSTHSGTTRNVWDVETPPVSVCRLHGIQEGNLA